MAVNRPRRETLVAQRQALFNTPTRRHSNFAMIAPERSGSIISASGGKIGASKQTARAWQSRSYELMDEVGELGYLLELKAQLLSRCKFKIEGLNDEGVWDSVPEEDKRPSRVMNAFVGPQGGQTELKRQAALHLSVAGEGYLLGSPLEEGGILWEFLSVDELRLTSDDKVLRSRSAHGESEELDPDTHYIARLWRPSARRSDEPDSEVKRVLRIAEEILTLTQMVDAIARSRLSAGLLYVPDEISFNDDEYDALAESSDVPDSLTDTLIEHMSAPVRDRESAAALVPLVMRGPADMADKVRLIDLARDMDTWAQSLRDEALTRLAQGLDTPPELMAGVGSSTNHWNAYQVDQDFASKHVAPLGEMLAEFLTFAYLRPMLTTFEDVPEADAANYRLVFDISPIAARSDEAASARSLYKDQLISDISMVRASGFAEPDMPGDEELTQRRMWELVMRAPQVFGPVFLPLIEGFEDVDFSALGEEGEEPGLPPSGDVEPTQDAQTGMEAPRTPVPGFSNLVRTVTVAADSALDRALERAGARIVTKSMKRPELKERLRSVPKQQALQLVDASELAAMSLTIDDLFVDAWTSLGNKTRMWIAEHLVDTGVDSLTAEDRAAFASTMVCTALADYVQKNAVSGFRVGPNRLRIPDAVVLSALGSLGPVQLASV